MCKARLAVAVLAVLALAGAAARADDRSNPSDDPDPGFLEFLGSVDRLAEVNPDYLSQSNPPRPGGTRVAAPAPPAPTPPSPPPPQPLPPSADASGGKNNE